MQFSISWPLLNCNLANFLSQVYRTHHSSPAALETDSNLDGRIRLCVLVNSGTFKRGVPAEQSGLIVCTEL